MGQALPGAARTTHLAYKPEHAVDLDTGAVVAAELHPADEGDTTTLEKTLAAAKENLEAVDAAPTAEDPAECVTDKGYHFGLKGARRRPLEDADLRAQAERFCALARRRGGPPGSHQQPDPAVIGRGQGSLQAARRDRERSFAHNLDRGGMRRTWLRGRETTSSDTRSMSPATI